MNCRNCNSNNLAPFADLGASPPSNAYLRKTDLSKVEKWFPLRVFVCRDCWLVQTEDFAGFDELFDENYAYFSSISKSWLAHCDRFVEEMVNRFSLNERSQVVEIAANDGYLLQFVKQRNIPCFGVEPTKSTAIAAKEKGIDIVEAFFGAELGRRLRKVRGSADLIIANNVLAHVPDIVDFAGGFAELLSDRGVASFEFPHLINLVAENQFDTLYHEHFSYLSLASVNAVFERVGLSVFDAEEISTHGGSLRVFAQLSKSGKHVPTDRLARLIDKEKAEGIETSSFYSTFQQNAEKVKDDFLGFLLSAKRNGKKVCGYGAAAKGNTLLNFAGVRPDLFSFVVDMNPAKQNMFMPGSRIPILSPDELDREKPDYIVILPWNISEEIFEQLAYTRTWGAKFVTAVPELSIK